MLFCDVTGSTALGERLDRPWLWPNASGPTVFLFSGACAVNVRFCGQGRVPWARRETLATPMRSVDKCETCQPGTEADGQLVTESYLSLRVPARVAAQWVARVGSVLCANGVQNGEFCALVKAKLTGLAPLPSRCVMVLARGGLRLPLWPGRRLGRVVGSTGVQDRLSGCPEAVA